MRCFHATVNRVRTRFPKETEVTNRETVSIVLFILFLDLLTQQMLGRSLLDGNKDHLLDQARSELKKQEHQVGSLNSCIDELSNKLVLKDWKWRTPITDKLNLEENNYACKKNYL